MFRTGGLENEPKIQVSAVWMRRYFNVVLETL